MQEDMHISIIIATRNRCSDLSRAIESIEDVLVPEGCDCEIVVVDNGSTDETPSVCSTLAKGGRKSLKYIYDPQHGKSAALNRAVRETQGDVLAFTDDDCIVDPNWIKEIVREFASDKHLALLGGGVRLYDERDVPITTVDGRGKIEITSLSMVLRTPLVIGCNMAVRREVFTRIGAFDVYMGPGTNAVFEDLDFVYRAVKSGFKAVFSDKAVVYHNHGRRTANEAKAIRYKYDIGRGAFYFKHMNDDRKVAKMAFSDVSQALTEVCTRKGVRWNLRFLWALSRGGFSRIRGLVRKRMA